MTALKQTLRLWFIALQMRSLPLSSLASLSLLFFCCIEQARATPEDMIKAGFVLNFAKFTEWPSGDASPTYNICSFSLQPLAGSLNELQEREAQGKAIKITTGISKDQLKTCHILYVTVADEPRFVELLSTLKHSPILTIGESAGFTAAGGMITLKQRNARFRFDINLLNVRTAGLNLSSRLLGLADQVVQ